MSFQQHHSNNGEAAALLGPGFHFHPTEEELMSYFLTQKVANSNSVFQAIGEVDFNKCEPWDLPAMAKVGDLGNFYFFSRKARKYPTGMQTNRATGAGYWKSTGTPLEVKSPWGELLGMKKTLVFYTKSGKTSWIMHEYRLPDESKSDQQQWVVCKVFKKKVPENASNKMAAKRSNFKDGTTPEQCNSTSNVTPDVDWNDFLENLASGWNMGSPEPM